MSVRPEEISMDVSSPVRMRRSLETSYYNIIQQSGQKFNYLRRNPDYRSKGWAGKNDTDTTL